MELSYIAGKLYLEPLAYSEPLYIQNPWHIQNTVKYLQWKVLQKNSYLAHFSASAPKAFPYKNFLKNPL